MQFKNLLECLDYFREESTCIDYLEQKRWNGLVVCPHCGNPKVYKTNRGYKCAAKTCLKKFSVISGSVYENTKLPLRIWFAAAYLISSSKKGISSWQVSRQLGISQKSSWFLLHRIREMLKEKAPLILANEVQIDEWYSGGLEKYKHKNKKANKALGVKRTSNDQIKTPVFGIIETQGKIVVKVSEWVSKRKAKQLIEKHVQHGTTMVTDTHAIYAFLGEDNRFVHVTVDHSKGEYVKGSYHTNSIENFWSLLSRGIIGVFHHVSPWHLQRYCDEFASRFNSRKLRDSVRFEQSVKNCSGRLKYKDLIK